MSDIFRPAKNSAGFFASPCCAKAVHGSTARSPPRQYLDRKALCPIFRSPKIRSYCIGVRFIRPLPPVGRVDSWGRSNYLMGFGHSQSEPPAPAPIAHDRPLSLRLNASAQIRSGRAPVPRALGSWLSIANKKQIGHVAARIRNSLRALAPLRRLLRFLGCAFLALAYRLAAQFHRRKVGLVQMCFV